MSSTPPTAVLKREDLHRLLKAALPFTATEALPQVAALRGIYLEEHDGQLRAWSNDRFTAALVKTNPDSITPGFEAVIDRDDVKDLLSLFKATGPGRSAPIALEVDGLSLRVRSSSEATFALIKPSNYPIGPVRRIFRDAVADTATVTGAGFNPALLARCKEAAAALGRGTDHMDLRLGSTDRKPVLVTLGEDFLGLIMPRASLNGDRLAPWAAEFSTGVTARAAS